MNHADKPTMTEPASGRDAAPVRKPAPRRRPRLDLPFDDRRPDAGEWTYDHRVGLCITLIAYLVLMILFVSSKIVVGRRASEQGMFIDLRTLAELEEERDRLEREIEERLEREQADWRSVRNVASNENASDERLRDDRGTNTAALNEAAVEAGERMRANREAWERGLAEARAISDRSGGEGAGAGEDAEPQDAKVSGNVTVRLDVKDPVRRKRLLPVPAYSCEGGGEVVVQITVDRAGDVVAARVLSGGDEQMREAALRTARRSRVNIDESAPARQTGTITYLFIPQ